MATQTSSYAAKKPPSTGRAWRRLVATLLTFSVVVTAGYSVVSLGVQYKDVTFPSRDDHLQLQGWFIPGVLPTGQLTSKHAIIMVLGNGNNRAEKSSGLLNLSVDLAKRGFAILAYDSRGAGQSSPASRSFGLYEQRDVLGAVDFLRAGTLAYPALGRPRAIAGWGVSLGAATLILAAAHEPAIRAIVSDSAFADIIPILQRDIPAQGIFPRCSRREDCSQPRYSTESTTTTPFPPTLLPASPHAPSC